MTIGKFTPGPWVSVNRGASWDIKNKTYPGADGKWIGCAHNDHKIGNEIQFGFPSNSEGEANARLIAQAPAMIEALMDLHPTIADDEMRKKVGAIIASALGE